MVFSRLPTACPRFLGEQAGVPTREIILGIARKTWNGVLGANPRDFIFDFSQGRYTCGFAIGSLITAIAPDLAILLAGRIVQALAFALVLPASLSLLNHHFPDGHRRDLAFSMWTAVIGSATAIGPLIGGILSTYASWRWAFLINVPLGFIAMAGVAMAIKTVAAKARKPGLEIHSAILLVVGLALFIFAIQEAALLGWWQVDQALTIYGWQWPFAISVIPFSIVSGLGLIILFIVVENRHERMGRDVVLEISLFRIPSYAWGTAAAALMTGTVMGLLLLLPLYGSYVHAYNAFQNGLALAPMGVGMAIGGPLSIRLGISTQRRPLQILLLLQALAVLLLIPLVSSSGQVWWLMLPLFIEGLAWGACYSILVNMLLRDVPLDLSGVAGGTQTMARLVCAAIATAVMTAILVAYVSSHQYQDDFSGLTSEQQQELRKAYNFTGQIHPKIIKPGITIYQLERKKAFNHAIKRLKKEIVVGIRLALIIGAFFSLLALLASFFIPQYCKEQVD